MNHFAKLLKDRVGFDAAGLAAVLDATYTQSSCSTEMIQKKSFAPSTLFYGHGACPRYWYLAFEGAEFVKEYDAYSVDNMRSGTDAHRRMQENFQSSPLNIEIEVELKNDDPPIRCFVDAHVIDFKGQNIVVEIKTTRSEAFAFLVAKNQGRDYQIMQLLVYMYLLKEKYGALLYENKNDHQKLLIPVEMTAENKARVEEVFEWMRMIRKNWEEGQLPKNPYRSNSRVCKQCPIKDWCFSKEEGTIKLPTLSY